MNDGQHYLLVQYCCVPAFSTQLSEDHARAPLTSQTSTLRDWETGRQRCNECGFHFQVPVPCTQSEGFWLKLECGKAAPDDCMVPFGSFSKATSSSSVESLRPSGPGFGAQSFYKGARFTA